MNIISKVTNQWAHNLCGENCSADCSWFDHYNVSMMLPNQILNVHTNVHVHEIGLGHLI